MKILITGGAGFIGSHLAEALIQRGNKVTVIDDLSTGSLDNIQHIKNHKNFRLVTDTVLNEEILKALVKKNNVIFHLAALTGVRSIMESPVETLRINVLGSFAILQLANKYGKRVFLASSSEVLGQHKQFPLTETANRIYGPTTIRRWGYACAKSIGEFLALAYYNDQQLPVTIIRFFNIIGPRQTGYYGMVVPRFINQALSNQPITVYGNGRQKRTFLYIKDAIDGVLSLLDCSRSAGEIFNIGGNEEVTISELAKKIKTISKTNSKIEYLSYSKVYKQRFEDIKRRVPDVSKARRILNWRVTTSLEEALRKTIEYFKEK